MALGAPVEARRAIIVKGPSLRYIHATLHEGITINLLWVDCIIGDQRCLLDMIGKLREYRRVSLLLCQMQVRKLWEILCQIAVRNLGTVAFSTCIKASFGVVQRRLLTLKVVLAVDGTCDALVLLARSDATAALLPRHLSSDGL